MTWPCGFDGSSPFPWLIRRLSILLALVCISPGSIPAGPSVAGRESAAAVRDSLHVSVDRFPYVEHDLRVPWPDERTHRADHFIICEAVIDTTGHVVSVRALGCEGEKGPLCDQVEQHVSDWWFVPAQRYGERVSVPVVFPVTFRATDDSGGRAGPPIVGTWDETLCPYDGRIYGSAELHATNRPAPVRRGAAPYPETARAALVSGHVVLKMVVDPEGVPCFVLCDSVDPPGAGFVEAATRAAYKYRFSPGLMNDRPQAVWVELPFSWEP